MHTGHRVVPPIAFWGIVALACGAAGGSLRLAAQMSGPRAQPAPSPTWDLADPVRTHTRLLRAQGEPPRARQADPAEAVFQAASQAWAAGHYVPALDGFARVLDLPGGERLLERIAELTGEVYHTAELAADGQRPQLSSDGRHAAYERGSGPEGTVHLWATDGGAPRRIATLRGWDLVFSPDGTRAAYLTLRETPALRRARAAGQPPDTLARLEARATRLVLRDLAAGREWELPDSGLYKTSITFAADGRAVYFVGAPESDSRWTNIYTVSEHVTAPTALTGGDGFKTVPRLLPGGRYLLYDYTPNGSGDMRLVLRELATGREQTFAPGAVSYAASGTAFALLSSQGSESVIQVVTLSPAGRRSDGELPISTAVRTTDPVIDHALSPDGRRVAYSRLTHENLELYLVGADGEGEYRLTREIQHDLAPIWLSPTRIFALIGEHRHRRSYLYDLATPAGSGGTGEQWRRRRLFHNNLVRTIAPEYEWAASANGAKLLIVADRDGDTVSPERGVYLMDLERPVTKEELRTRLTTSLAAERELRARGERLFRPITEAVRRAVAQVDISRLYEYQQALAALDSKFLTQPGNRAAIEYLRRTYATFGYQPELQWFDAAGTRSANVLAILRGTEHPDVVYVVGSHFDSVKRGPGADDNTSGTAVLLETARVLAQTPLPATVIFASLTGEEAGLFGSREFVRRAVADRVHIAGALNNDMLGWSNDYRLDNTIRYTNPGIRDVQHAAAFLFSDLITYDARYYKSTDAAAFYEVYGDIIGGIGSYPVLGNPHYHAATDRLETINQALVRETTKATVASIMLLASSPSRLTGLEVSARHGHTAEVRWNPSPEADIRSYVVTWGAEEAPTRHTRRVAEPHVQLTDVGPGTVVAVKAINVRGLEGWDWARLRIPRRGNGVAESPSPPSAPGPLQDFAK